MKNTSLKSDKNTSSKIIKCAIICLLTKLILFFISGYIISSVEISPDNISIFWYAISFITGAVTGFAAGRSFGKRGILWGAATGFFGAFIQMTFLFILSGFNFNPYLLIILPCEVIAGAIGGIIATNLKQ